MAYNFTRASQMRITGSSTLAAFPLTLAAWFKPASVAVGQTVFGLRDAANSGGRKLIYLNSAALSLYSQDDSTGSVLPAATGSATAGVWTHGCCVFAASNSYTVYRDGGNSASATTNVAFGTPNQFSIGVDFDTNNYFGGDIAECAAWTAALTAAEVAALAKGFGPAKVRPASLVFYAPLVRDIVDLRAGLALTATNTPTVAVHPRIY